MIASIIELLAGRSEISAGEYTIKSNGATFHLNLSEPGMGYVAGIYDHNGHSHISQFKYSIEKTDNGASRIYVVVPSNDTMGKMFVVNWKGQVVKQCDLISGHYVDILPPLIGEPKYKLWFGPNCTGADCPQFVDFEVQMGSAHVLHVHDGVTEADLYELVSFRIDQFLENCLGSPQYCFNTLGHSSVYCHYTRGDSCFCYWSGICLLPICTEHEIRPSSSLAFDRFYWKSH